MSTLHTNSAVGTIARLLDIGAKGYMLATAITGILAQRLVRRICQQCKTSHNIDDSDRVWLETTFPGIREEHMTFSLGAGCSHCQNIGYRGRIGVYELLTLGKDAKQALRNEDIQQFTSCIEQQRNYITLARRGLQLARQGIISLEEVMRITTSGEQEIAAPKR